MKFAEYIMNILQNSLELSLINIHGSGIRRIQKNLQNLS